jgi:Zn-dependent peptidase ImmA (M78 family)
MPDIEKLKEIIKELQKIMRIQDWNIGIELVSGYEMTKQGGELDDEGLAYRDIRHNKAIIYLNKELVTDGWYYVIVHEMLHIQSTMIKFTADSYFEHEHDYFNTVYEQYNDNLSRMFISLYPVTNFIKEDK